MLIQVRSIVPDNLIAPKFQGFFIWHPSLAQAAVFDGAASMVANPWNTKFTETLAFPAV